MHIESSGRKDAISVCCFSTWQYISLCILLFQ